MLEILRHCCALNALDPRVGNGTTASPSTTGNPQPLNATSSTALQSVPAAQISSFRIRAHDQAIALNPQSQIVSIAPAQKLQKAGAWIYSCIAGRDKNHKVVDTNATTAFPPPQTQHRLLPASELSRQLLYHYRKHTSWLVRFMTISWCTSGALSEFMYIGIGAKDSITPTGMRRPQNKDPPDLPSSLEYDYEKFSTTPSYEIQRAYLHAAIRHYLVDHVRFQWPRALTSPITCTPDDNGVCDMAKFVDHIPKKSPLSVPKVLGKGAYCLEGCTELSFAKAVLLLSLNLVAGAVFAIVYMALHPDDWEKGLVPLTVVLAGVPVYLGLIVLWKANVS